MKQGFFRTMTTALVIAAITCAMACQDTEKKAKDSPENNGTQQKETIDRQIPETVLKELGVIRELRPQVQLDIPHVYSEGVSSLASLSGVLKAYEPDLVAADIVFYSGPIYEQIKEERGGRVRTVNVPMRSSTLLLSTVDNLGCEAFVGYNKMGFKELKRSYLQEGVQNRYQEFKNEAEAFKLLKRILSSEAPVIANIDTEFIGEQAGSEFVVVTGYDADNVYINDSSKTMEEDGKDRPIKTADFLKSWSSGQVKSTPNVMLFIRKVKTKKPDVEILAQIKKECQVISSYLNKDADGLEKSIISPESFKSFGELGSAKRGALAIYLKKKNFEGASDRYNELAKQYAEIHPDTKIKETAKKLRELAKKEKEATASWE